MRGYFTGSFVAVLVAALLVCSLGSSDAEARSRHHRGDAAVAGAVIGLFGTIAALAARDTYRDRYDYGPSYYYGSPYAYDPPVYRYRHWHHRRHHHW